MAAPIGIQLYTVREALNEDFVDTVTKIAEMGYAGVETAGFPGTTAADAKKLFDDLGLQVLAAHTSFPRTDDKNKLFDEMGALGTKRMINAALPPDKYATIDGIKEICEMLNQANADVKAHGMSFGVHNHWWEFELVQGKYPYHIWLDELDNDIFFEVDTYWAQTAGLDAAGVVLEMGNRAPLLHIKDGPATQAGDMVAVGQGIMDVPGVIAAGVDNTEWLVVELDRCTTDMLTAVSESYAYLVGEGLARGNK